MSDSSKAVCLKDVEEAAHKILPKKALDYYKSGAEQQSTLRDNSRAFQRYQGHRRSLNPQLLPVFGSQSDLDVEILIF